MAEHPPTFSASLARRMGSVEAGSGLVRVPVAFQGPGSLDDAESDRSSRRLDDV
jgi:hypothetical protein